MNRRLERVFESLGLDRTVRRLARPLSTRWRSDQARQRREFGEVLGGVDPARDFNIRSYPSNKTLLVVGYAQTGLASVQAPVILAARLAGYRVVATLPAAHFAAAAFYRALGVERLIETDSMSVRAPRGRAGRLLAHAATPAELLDVCDREVPVGKFAASTLMRRLRAGRVDPSDKKIRPALLDALTASLRAVGTAERVLDATQPDVVVFYDRGYTPDGELFELALAQGARAITTNTAHKSGYLLFKGYDTSNKDSHPGALAPATWRRLRDMPWTSDHWEELHREIVGCYESGLWYDEVGTQFNTRPADRAELAAMLGLDADRPTAVVFPHLFWDATFFWGTDLFDDYRDWFVHVVRAAANNPSLNWIIKVHPANVVKDARDGYTGEWSETSAIREALGTLPAHMSVIAPDSHVSTISLYDLMDYCLTVRGTVGIEAAMFGRQVLTAGTGRYDGLGFTIDSSSRDEYLDRLARLHTIPMPHPAQTELARRYAYGLFLQRPLPVTCLRFAYARDAGATLKATLALPRRGRLEDSADLRILSEWLANPTEDDLIGAAAMDAARSCAS